MRIRNYLLVAAAFFALSFLFVCGNHCQPHSHSPLAESPRSGPNLRLGSGTRMSSADKEQHIVGGYTEQTDAASKDEALKLAHVAWTNNVQFKSNGDCSLDGPVEILSVCTQVVAGTNYRITFRVKERCGLGAEPQVKTYEAVVFVALPYTKSPPHVTSLKEVHA